MLAARLPGASSRPDALPPRAFCSHRREERGAPISQQPEVHTMTETPSPEDKNLETATPPDTAASEGNGDPAPVTPEQATAEAAVAADAPSLDETPAAPDESETGGPAAAYTPASTGPADEMPTTETPVVTEAAASASSDTPA